MFRFGDIGTCGSVPGLISHFRRSRQHDQNGRVRGRSTDGIVGDIGCICRTPRFGGSRRAIGYQRIEGRCPNQSSSDSLPPVEYRAASTARISFNEKEKVGCKQSKQPLMHCLSVPCRWMRDLRASAFGARSIAADGVSRRAMVRAERPSTHKMTVAQLHQQPQPVIGLEIFSSLVYACSGQNSRNQFDRGYSRGF